MLPRFQHVDDITNLPKALGYIRSHRRRWSERLHWCWWRESPAQWRGLCKERSVRTASVNIVGCVTVDDLVEEFAGDHERDAALFE